mmetsp:Transcript_22645/g.67420  ORF Transcript_22645/g.67420 Transcript_22645/m.67420 type:complete len:206 (-) Transcript_22645:558-1175(-)
MHLYRLSRMQSILQLLVRRRRPVGRKRCRRRRAVHRQLADLRAHHRVDRAHADVHITIQARGEADGVRDALHAVDHRMQHRHTWLEVHVVGAHAVDVLGRNQPVDLRRSQRPADWDVLHHAERVAPASEREERLRRRRRRRRVRRRRALHAALRQPDLQRVSVVGTRRAQHAQQQRSVDRERDEVAVLALALVLVRVKQDARRKA